MLVHRAVVQGAVLRCAACDGWEMLRAGLRGGCACLGSRRCVLIARGRRRAGLRGGHGGPSLFVTHVGFLFAHLPH